MKRERAESMLSRAEYQYSMENYDASMGLLEDYAGEMEEVVLVFFRCIIKNYFISELAIQYGYVTLFVSAFPLAPFLALFSNIVEIRTDGWKLLHAYRRANPLGAEDIGTWFAIFQVISLDEEVDILGRLMLLTLLICFCFYRQYHSHLL